MLTDTAVRSGRDKAATFSDYVFDQLRDDIVSGAFPAETRLAMKELTERYQVGTSPLREALHRLAGEGFVQFVGQRGFKVPSLSREDLEDLIALRSLVEEAAMRQAIARGDDAWEAGIVGAFHKLERQANRIAHTDDASVIKYEVVHRAFHVSLYAGVTSPRLAALHSNLFDQAFRYRKALHGAPVEPHDVLDEHRSLMEIVLSRNADAAVQVIRAHFELTRIAASPQFAITTTNSIRA
ncbi:MAG: FCD domain-containing protein [Burkholderiaceae bacterium]|nr:FCD domain-containing protein [Burkholderiaceae bacterium]